MSLGTYFKDISEEKFDELKSAYLAAKIADAKAREVIKANNANKLETYKPSGNQNGNLVVMFMNIGTGDCIFIKTPKGKTLVVDCGQAASLKNRPQCFDEIQERLISPMFLGGKEKDLYALILTHPDRDHYNKVKEIIEPNIASIKHLFYTLNIGDYSENEVREYMKKADIFSQVTVRENEINLLCSEKDTSWENFYAPLEGNRVQILGHDPTGKRKGWDEDGCSIYILAAEVSPAYNDEASNSGSIVLLIETKHRRILLCGDATWSTENFLRNQHKARIANVDLAQLEHHGSYTQHADKEFVKELNPILAVASAGPHNKFFHPQWDTIFKFIDPKTVDLAVEAHRLRKDMDAHPVKYGNGEHWTDMTNNSWKKTYSEYGLYVTESNNDLCFIVDPDGNLIREYSDGAKTHTYKFSLSGERSVSSVDIKKA